MFKKTLLISFLALAPTLALAQQNYVASTVGSIPPTVNLGNISPSGLCVYSGITSLTVGQAIPIPCDAHGNLIVDVINGGGGGGGAVTAVLGAFVNGSIVELGNTTDVACAAYNTSACTENQLDRLIAELLTNGIAVTGTFWQATQPVSGNVGGFDSGPVQASVAVNSSSHAAGTSLGGLITIPIARTSGGSGGVSSILYKSSKGSVGQVVLRLWSRNPSGTTCTDNTAFAGSSTDDAYLLTGPIPLTPQAPPVTTGDAATYAPYFPGRLSFATNGNANIYGCAVTVAIDTADESGNVIVTVGGDLN